MRILLVEDDPRRAELVSEGLANDGLTVEHAPSATVGDAMSEMRTYDLILLEGMPPEGREAGFKLARALRGPRDPTPIRFLTARGDQDSRLEGLEGGDDYLPKPFDFHKTPRPHLGLGTACQRSLVQPRGANAQHIKEWCVSY